MPDCNGLFGPTMPDINIFVDGVWNLLESLDVAKTLGPDGIPTRIFCRNCPNSYSNIYTIIKQWSKDWLTTIFKKGDQGDPSIIALLHLHPFVARSYSSL